MGNLKLVSGDIIENSKDVEAIVNPTNKFAATCTNFGKN